MSSDARRVIAMLFVLVSAFTDSARAEEPEADDTRARIAAERFHEGVELARAGRCDEAVAAFEASLDAHERPNAHFNLARCEERLMRWDRAAEHYRAFVRLAPAGHPSRSRAEERLASLVARIGVIEIRTTVPGTAFVGDRRLGPTPGSYEVAAGPVAVEIVAEDGSRSLHSIVVTPGQSTVLEIAPLRELDPPAPPTAALDVAEPRSEPPRRELVSGAPRRSHRAFLASVGATSAAFVATAIVGGWTFARHQRGLEIDPYDAARREAAQRGVRRMAFGTDIAAAATVGAGAVALATGLRSRGSRDERTIVISPTATRGFVGAIAAGTWQ